MKVSRSKQSLRVHEYDMANAESACVTQRKVRCLRGQRRVLCGLAVAPLPLMVGERDERPVRLLGLLRFELVPRKSNEMWSW